MESLNKVELKGMVGNVKTQNIGDTESTTFSICVSNAYKAMDTAIIEDNWFSVTTFQKRLNLSKGDKVHLLGRLKTVKYTDSQGIGRAMVSILAQKVEKI